MKASRIILAAWMLGALLIISVAMIRGLRSSSPAPAEAPATPQAPASVAPAPTPAAPVPAPVEPASTVPSEEAAPVDRACQLTALVEDFRKAKGSPAYRNYLRFELSSLRWDVPAETFWIQLVAEEDPEVLELLAEEWVTRYAQSQDAKVLKQLLEHLASERNPARRATLIRALRHTGEPSTELLGRSVLKGQDVYAAWVKDEAPEVRQAVVENVRTEAKRGFGRFQGVAEKAVALADAATEPTVKAALLTASSLEAARAPAVARVRELLQKSESPEVRAAAATALGTVSVPQSDAAQKALVAQYKAGSERQVRSAILEALSRLSLGKAVPVLQQLRGVDASMHGEVDRWLTLLSSQPQTWQLLDRDRRATEARTRQQ
jgi:hypothetical protein